ncbi:hypothetical protein [Campylobacter troglodytis]|uniref:hypothetical protein n=1 Tax=Campylobacter troglodytis TaxID=654363 RepID=UPI0011590953|nr:hypothetical protein [Campylobacter troglodytis]TQR61179.1 hypothetical protein DMC01_02610 [Campylobacter troglodytis]
MLSENRHCEIGRSKTVAMDKWQTVSLNHFKKSVNLFSLFKNSKEGFLNYKLPRSLHSLAMTSFSKFLKN